MEQRGPWWCLTEGDQQNNNNNATMLLEFSKVTIRPSSVFAEDNLAKRRAEKSRLYSIGDLFLSSSEILPGEFAQRESFEKFQVRFRSWPNSKREKSRMIWLREYKVQRRQPLINDRRSRARWISSQWKRQSWKLRVLQLFSKMYF